jgi:cysteine desulfurase/selenocysteine lyase
MSQQGTLDVERVRRHFDFVDRGRIVTNNAASTQAPRELVQLYQALVPGYENVHRGQSTAPQTMTELFEGSYDTIAAFVYAPSRRNIVVCRNTTEPSTPLCTRCSRSSAMVTTSSPR